MGGNDHKMEERSYGAGTTPTYQDDVDRYNRIISTIDSNVLPANLGPEVNGEKIRTLACV